MYQAAEMCMERSHAGYITQPMPGLSSRAATLNVRLSQAQGEQNLILNKLRTRNKAGLVGRLGGFCLPNAPDIVVHSCVLYFEPLLIHLDCRSTCTTMDGYYHGLGVAKLPHKAQLH